MLIRIQISMLLSLAVMNLRQAVVTSWTTKEGIIRLQIYEGFFPQGEPVTTLPSMEAAINVIIRNIFDLIDRIRLTSQSWSVRVPLECQLCGMKNPLQRNECLSFLLIPLSSSSTFHWILVFGRKLLVLWCLFNSRKENITRAQPQPLAYIWSCTLQWQSQKEGIHGRNVFSRH